MRITVMALLAGGLLGLGGCGMFDRNDDRPIYSDNGDGNGTQTGTQTTSFSDESFVRQVAEIDQMEVEVGRLAMEKAENDEVRRFAQRMVNDHTRTTQELRDVASGQRINLPTEQPRNLAYHINQMSRLEGHEFDRHYIDMMVNDHQKAIELFERASRNARNGSIREFAGRHLPTLREHQEQARQLQTRLSGNNAGFRTNENNENNLNNRNNTQPRNNNGGVR